ncbi:hypothetical protein [Fischerella thermalis]|uniref:hypothetical protein n=1 Tax=Fischerella thermalis TaxID=372787 RepID=UPI0002ED64CE|nr:hypothetical protein [Fischerella thermalis]
MACQRRRSPSSAKGADKLITSPSGCRRPRAVTFLTAGGVSTGGGSDLLSKPAWEIP